MGSHEGLATRPNKELEHDDRAHQRSSCSKSDALNAADSVLVALFTSVITDAPLYRLTIAPTPENGLKTVSQGIVDKVLAYPRAKCGPVMKHLTAAEILVLNTMLSVMIGLAG